MTKACKKCGEEKPLGAYNRRRSDCKTCQTAYRRRYYEANRERICAKSRDWYDRNPDQGRANAQKWREENNGRYLELKAAYEARQKAERAAKAKARRAWKAANPQIEAERVDRNRESTTRRSREWRQKNPDKRKAQKMRHRGIREAAAGASYTTAALVAARVAMFGGCCRYCGAPATEIDHRIPLSRGGSHWPANLVPACRSCNATKNAKTEREFVAA